MPVLSVYASPVSPRANAVLARQCSVAKQGFLYMPLLSLYTSALFAYHCFLYMPVVSLHISAVFVYHLCTSSLYKPVLSVHASGLVDSQ